MKKIQTLILTIVLVLLSTGCSLSYSLPFNVLIEKAPFLVIDPPGNQPVSNLIILASRDEIVPPAPGIQYSEGMIETLKEVDFNKSFVVLHQVGQIADNGEISEILRRGNTIQIELQSYSVRPGNYMLIGFSMPYQMTAIEKNGASWGKDINFILEVEDGNTLEQTRHYIP
jgi:hypothetical protein